IEKYGADALRSALVFGVKEGSDQSLSEEKIVGMRNFANKVWNIGRFIYLNIKYQKSIRQLADKNTNQISKILKKLEKEFKLEKEKYLKLMEGFRFSQALGLVYQFLWHRFADYYLEQLKGSLKAGNIKAFEALKEVYFENLKMLHPFAPFVTEAIWKIFKGKDKSILNLKF
ncbi:MAG: class I tRNA ligase family protein, partial [Microgenomates group bacterium]